MTDQQNNLTPAPPPPVGEEEEAASKNEFLRYYMSRAVVKGTHKEDPSDEDQRIPYQP